MSESELAELRETNEMREEALRLKGREISDLGIMQLQIRAIYLVLTAEDSSYALDLELAYQRGLAEVLTKLETDGRHPEETTP